MRGLRVRALWGIWVNKTNSLVLKQRKGIRQAIRIRGTGIGRYTYNSSDEGSMSVSMSKKTTMEATYNTG